MKAKGLIRTIRKDVKLLGVGELTTKLTITVHAASATAREKVEAAGGTLTLLKEPKVKKAKKHKATPTAEAEEADETTVEAPAETEAPAEPEQESEE